MDVTRGFDETECGIMEKTLPSYSRTRPGYFHVAVVFGALGPQPVWLGRSGLLLGSGCTTFDEDSVRQKGYKNRRLNTVIQSQGSVRVHTLSFRRIPHALV